MRGRSDLIEEEITPESDDQANFSLRVFRCCHDRKIHVGHSSRPRWSLLLAEFMLRWKEKTAYSEPGDWVFASF